MNWGRLFASIITVAFGIAGAIGFSVLLDKLPNWTDWPIIILCLLFIVVVVYFKIEEKDEEPKLRGWVAVDKDSVGNRRVSFFPLKPYREELGDRPYWAAVRPFDSLALDSSAFPDMDINDEPIEVELTVKEV